MTTITRDLPMRQTLRDPSEVTRLRHALVDRLQELGFDGQAHDAGIMVSELVANALEHGHSAAVVSLVVDDQQARVSVHDDSPALPAIQPVDPHRVGGNGMRVVDAFAETWGVEPERVGKTVWFTVRRPAVA